MVGSALALSLIGFGAVQALPVGKPIEERQGSGISIGDGSATFTPGQGDLPVCLTNVPLNQQPPCLLPPIVGGFTPPTTPKGKRQISLGDPTGSFTPGQGSLPPCLTTVPLSDQPPCFLAPIPGDLTPPTPNLKGKRQLSLGPGSGTFIPGQGGLPTCVTTKPLSEQPPCIMPPLPGGFLPGGSLPGGFLPPGGNIPPTVPKTKRTFVLPPDAEGNPKKAIEQLELQLEALQNKEPKTQDDLDQIDDIKAALRYIAGITNISAPPGTGSTFTPGKRSFVLPPDANSNPKKVIAELELELEALQNKEPKTDEDCDEMDDIKAALKYLAGITSISAPPGTGSTFTPGGAVPGGPMVPDPAVPGSPATPSTRRRRQTFHLGSPIPGGPLIPDHTVPGGPMVPSTRRARRQTFHLGSPISGGPIIPDHTVPGGPMVPSTRRARRQTFHLGSPISGGPIIPDHTVPGGPMIPDHTVPGGPMVPST